MLHDDPSLSDLVAALQISTSAIVDEASPAASSPLEPWLLAVGPDSSIGWSSPPDVLALAIRAFEPQHAVAEDDDASSALGQAWRADEIHEAKARPLPDEFAARLTAAFMSGALDPRARASMVKLSQAPRTAGAASRSNPTPSLPQRGPSMAGHDNHRQKYRPSGLSGPPLYSPW